jgi:pyruvate dehydrogenase E1 component beta subunit
VREEVEDSLRFAEESPLPILKNSTQTFTPTRSNQAANRLLMATITIREALNQALREELARDETFSDGRGSRRVRRRLQSHEGTAARVWRQASHRYADHGARFCRLGVGAAMAGLRPIVEFMTFNFSILATDQIINSAAKMLYMSGGQFNIPIVFRGPGGSAFQVSSQHSQALESWYAYFPG